MKPRPPEQKGEEHLRAGLGRPTGNVFCVKLQSASDRPGAPHTPDFSALPKLKVRGLTLRLRNPAAASRLEAVLSKRRRDRRGGWNPEKGSGWKLLPAGTKSAEADGLRRPSVCHIGRGGGGGCQPLCFLFIKLLIHKKQKTFSKLADFFSISFEKLKEKKK